mmetsp:Transcript_81077/g.227352  ORF Transcript_81077/g.227352 Transcript_81077/m.227352 type:complete len:301 (+) Transcript_81077:108-1010(+)
MQASSAASNNCVLRWRSRAARGVPRSPKSNLRHQWPLPRPGTAETTWSQSATSSPPSSASAPTCPPPAMRMRRSSTASASPEPCDIPCVPERLPLDDDEDAVSESMAATSALPGARRAWMSLCTAAGGRQSRSASEEHPRNDLTLSRSSLCSSRRRISSNSPQADANATRVRSMSQVQSPDSAGHPSNDGIDKVWSSRPSPPSTLICVSQPEPHATRRNLNLHAKPPPKSPPQVSSSAANARTSCPTKSKAICETKARAAPPTVHMFSTKSMMLLWTSASDGPSCCVRRRRQRKPSEDTA